MKTEADAMCEARIARLREDVMNRGGSYPPQANRFLTDVALHRAIRQANSRVQQRARFLLELVQIAPIEIRPDWHLAGNHLCPERFATIRAEAGELDEMLELGVSEDDLVDVRETVRAWHGRRREADVSGGTACYAVGDCDSELQTGRGGWGDKDSRTVYWASGWQENHSVRDYAKVLDLGYLGIREEVERRLDSAEISDPDFPRKENFWRAAISICDAGALLGERYAEVAAKMAEEADSSAERERLITMAQTCRRVPATGARTFAEAVQSLWLAHVLTCGEDGINANSLGRLDQILYPFYVRDKQEGRLTREEAVEIMAELACRLYLDYDVQAITLGGVDRSGHSAVNELSHVILDATEKVDFARDVSVRLDRETPAEFVDHAAGLIARGGGIPFIFNDECFIPALTKRGIATADARDYAPIGCIELTVPGRANPHAVSGWFNAAKCLELAVFDGCDPATGTRLGPPTGTLGDHGNYRELYEAYCRQVEHFAPRMVYHCNRGELMQREAGPLPCWSVLTDDCIERGRDITDGGPVYNYHSVCFLGTANVADSLAAIKKLVFEDGRLEPGDLTAALREDFAGREPLRQLLLNGAPKYGNDGAEVDDIAAEVCRDFIDLMDGMRSLLGGRYFVHLFSFRCNVDFGHTVGALPDGRRAGQPLAYSLSAQQGRDRTGVTAMLRSLARLPHEEAAGASAAIVELDPKVLQGPEGVQRLSQLIQSAIRMGVGQLQWNVVTTERLEKAQEDPERYGNITVRVAGYSQMFRLVPPELQEHIIARTKHRR